MLNMPSKSSNDKTITALLLNKLQTLLLWAIFACVVVYAIMDKASTSVYFENSYFRINAFTLLIWGVVSFFSAIISGYSKEYMKGFKRQKAFIGYAFGFTLSVMLLVASNHVIPFLLSWLFMGVFMSQLIGVDSKWEDAKQAAKHTRNYFLTSTLFLMVAVLCITFYLKKYTLTAIVQHINSLPTYISIISGLCVVMAAIIQSAIFPFHKWLLSAMTAPTPASALMHAGFVNGGGILLALFSSLIISSNMFDILFVLGGLTAIVAQFTKLLQVHVKQKLACSTIAQMGFMVMQCGLGFFNAAVAHLILHGLYKAYLFLSAGENVQLSKPEALPKLKINAVQSILVVVYSILGAFLFTTLTGKGGNLNSGIFLTLIVAITIGQITYNIVKQQVFSWIQKFIVPPVLFLSGIVIYALLFNGVSIIMAQAEIASGALPLSGTEILFGVVFLVSFFIMKLGVYRKIPWLYVKLLNMSQPDKNTVLN